MKCRYEWRPGTDLIDVWLWQPDFSGTGSRIVRLARGGAWSLEEVDQLQRPEPTLTMPGEFLKPLIAEMADVLPPDRAQARHLEDAVKVRDRLLALVEWSVGGDGGQQQ